MVSRFVLPGLKAETSLNRRSEKRSDKTYIHQALEHPEAKFVIAADLKVPIVPGGEGTITALRWHPRSIAAALGLCDFVFLGEELAGIPVFAGNLAAFELSKHQDRLESWKPLVDLRSLALQGSLPEDELLIAAQARAILGWHAVNRCCGKCGAATAMADAGWRRRCHACNTDFYPRTDPAVIMLITHGGKCLLGHEHRFPEKLYSTLAGFVEAGDDIEHAVRREIMEEAGIEVGAVHYVASQPWPFPHSLMIGCWGEALSDKITVDPSELADARWFSRDDVSAMMELRHPEGLIVPPSISMAHVLLRAFLDGQLQTRRES